MTRLRYWIADKISGGALSNCDFMRLEWRYEYIKARAALRDIAALAESADKNAMSPELSIIRGVAARAREAL